MAPRLACRKFAVSITIYDHAGVDLTLIPERT